VSAYDFTYERYRSGAARWVHTTQKLRSLRRADAVLCISDATRRDIIEHCPDIDPAKLHVVHLGVDTAVFHPQPTQPSLLAEGTVLFVGQRGGYKRFDLAVQALRQCPRLTLGIVGPALSGEERSMLTKALGERWRDFGAVRTAQLRALYSASFAFIFPSDYEGFGLPVLEAMASGCAVVAANTSSLPEVGGAAALYAQTQDASAYAAALQALESATARADHIQAGLARAQEFPWSRTLELTFALYRR
jgi:mannosyltransferase